MDHAGTGILPDTLMEIAGFMHPRARRKILSGARSVNAVAQRTEVTAFRFCAQACAFESGSIGLALP